MLLGLWMICSGLAGAVMRRPPVVRRGWFFAAISGAARRRNAWTIVAAVGRWLMARNNGNIREGPD